MKIGIVIRENHEVWGGDLKVVFDLKEGLESLGCRVAFSPSVAHLLDSDFILLTNSTQDLRSHCDLLDDISFGVLCFHEDSIQYASACYGFVHYIEKCLQEEVENGVPFSLDRLIATPHIVNYFGFLPMRSSYYNHEVLQRAKFCLVNSDSEEKIVKRDCPSARCKIIPLAAGFSPSTGAFDLVQGEYILQVGRFETRKNQLASILATRNVDIPLVFIAMKTHQPWYEKLCVQTILAYRTHPTLVISETLESAEMGNLRIVQMPHGKKLPAEVVASAFRDCSLYLHPAFCEVPGLIFFEAARFGVPVVASQWCTIKDSNLAGMEYPLPYDIAEIEKSVGKLLGTRTKPDHPIFSRSSLDYAREVLNCIEQEEKIITGY